MCIGKNKSSTSLQSTGSRKRSPKPERKKSNSIQFLKNSSKPRSQTRVGVKQNIIPAILTQNILGFKQSIPENKQNNSATRKNNPAKQNNSATKQNVNQSRKNSVLDIKQNISKVKVPFLDTRKDEANKQVNTPKESPKLKVKNRGVVTREVYPAVVSEKNKQTYVDAAKVWKTEDTPEPKESPGPSKSENPKRRRSLKLAVRRQLWNWSKHALKDNEHWSKLFQENSIDVDKINIDKVDLDLINMDGLGIENKFVRRTVEWLLK